MRTRIVGYVVIALLLVAGGYAGKAWSQNQAASQDHATKLTQAQASSQLLQSGVTWRSSGDCTDWYGSSCTSVEQINESTVIGLIALRRASSCPVVLTSGTEVGHDDDGGAHWRGTRVSIAKNTCLTRYLRSQYDGAATPGVARAEWTTPAGVHFADTGKQWDVTYPAA